MQRSFELPSGLRRWYARLRAAYQDVPISAWLVGMLAAVLVEALIGRDLAYILGLGNLPSFFGLSLIFKKWQLIPNILVFIAVVYVIPALGATYLVRKLMARLSGRGLTWLDRLPSWGYILFNLAFVYVILHFWASASDYRLLVLRLLGVNIILTLSLNLVNGWMGEFSVSVAGFMAVGAYVASVLMVWGFVDDNVFGPAVFPASWAPFAFPIALIIAGAVTAVTALAVAIPSFRTRGDYLAIITLAYMFIVKSSFENIDFLGGARGFMGQPKVAESLLVVFVWTVLAVWIMYNYVTSTLGKATSAVRDNEPAAEMMTVNTRKVKMVAFLTHAFWSGVAGGLYAHIVGYINPSSFGLVKSAEILGMLYLGGLNSVTGSILGTVLFTMLSEILRPLKLIKWMVIPVILIIVMIKRPRGLLGFQEIRLPFLERRAAKADEEVSHAPAGD
ncbi:MAG: branched-chain amino acid ABC transporter permease [Chloroflexi bacterium]|nr:branched-chain amino acid ABC transporter permease [Chloroflexota bacterium]